MKLISYYTDLSCSMCGKSYTSHEIQTICAICNAPLIVNYELKTLKHKLDRDDFAHRSKGMWRWSELLPVYNLDNIVSLGEGDTPMLRLINMCRELGFPPFSKGG